MKRLLIGINLILVLALGIIIYREGYIPKLKQKFFPDNSLAHYQNRPEYKEQLSRYGVYTKKADIVMLGTSLTQDIDWNELMNRPDIINRGYGGDIFAVMATRLPYVLAAEPKICFIEGGINEIDTGVPITEFSNQLSAIIDTLQHHSVIPVLTAITFVTNNAYDHKKRNEQIALYNREMKKLAASRAIVVIDNNPVLAPKGYLEEKFAKNDGLHYLPKTYLVWKAAIEKVLVQYGF